MYYCKTALIPRNDEERYAIVTNGNSNTQEARIDMNNSTFIKLSEISPYIRYVNNYEPACSYVEKERIIFDYELMYVMEGSADIYYDGKKYQLNKSDLFYLKPGITNHMVVDYEKHFRIHCIHFDWVSPEPKYNFTAEEFYMHSILSPDHNAKEELLKTRPNREPIDFDIPAHLKGTPYDKLAPLFERSYYIFTCRTEVSELKLKSVFFEITAELLEILDKKNDIKRIHPKIIHAIEYIKSNYSRHITTPELAKKYGLSPKYFGTIFKEATGKSISEFLLQHRIYAAKEMLIGTDMTIEEIAEKTGFSNQFYFSKCFKDMEKLAPSTYRDVMRMY